MEELRAEGCWVGELSASALSTATAVVALAEMDRAGPEASRHSAYIARGLAWLAAHVNADGGWGDTIRSRSNPSTTALCWAAFGAAREDGRFHRVDQAGGELAHGASGGRANLVAAIEGRYGKDRTFSVPILMTLALIGRLAPAGWKQVRPLPFELAALPHRLFGALQLPVVSYALPALIAIGQATITTAARRSAVGLGARALPRLDAAGLERIQPDNGGFLEATPLTSFVTMGLAAMGQQITQWPSAARHFFAPRARPDGSWPIDTNLSTWVTTLALKALQPQPDALSPEQKLGLREWLLRQQDRSSIPTRTPRQAAGPGPTCPAGFPMPTTPLALCSPFSPRYRSTLETRQAGVAGVRWLLDLQNRDGGIPTFCRGWGALPFDRSSADITAHALRAWSAWQPQLDAPALRRVRRRPSEACISRREQRTDGAWLPLWFGNEHADDEGNPLYGTAHVVLALRDLQQRGQCPGWMEDALRGGLGWLARSQNANGGWGGAAGLPSTVEETALALEALAGSEFIKAVDTGTAWLAAQVLEDGFREAAPIGFYFARLWYFERLYPLIFAAGALGRVTALERLTAVQ